MWFFERIPLSSNGLLGACNPGVTGNGTFNFTEDWQIGLVMSSPTQYGYVPNNGSDSISVCVINSDSTIGTCTLAYDDTFDQPSSVTLYTRVRE